MRGEGKEGKCWDRNKEGCWKGQARIRVRERTRRGKGCVFLEERRGEERNSEEKRGEERRESQGYLSPGAV